MKGVREAERTTWVWHLEMGLQGGRAKSLATGLGGVTLVASPHLEASN